MSGGIRLGSFASARIIADASVFILILLFGLAVLVDLDSLGVAASGQARGFAALAGSVGLLFGVLVHELSHAVVAMRRSMIVSEVRIFMFGGYSVITGEPSPRDEAAIAVAGPLMSFLVAAVAGLGVVVLGSDSVVGRTMWLLALANIAIAVFNLLPGFPLDGARVLRGVLTARSGDRLRATRVVNVIGRSIGWLTVALGVALMVTRQPVGLFVVVGGWFLAQAAASVGRREALSVALDGMTVRDVMRRTSDAVQADWTVSAMLDLYGL
ncbi:MAG: site-2 protease family protein, partial [Actinomycetia bacterium]|nr:site-2 protease family protein [Actinomycetes bacterium]